MEKLPFFPIFRNCRDLDRVLSAQPLHSRTPFKKGPASTCMCLSTPRPTYDSKAIKQMAPPEQSEGPQNAHAKHRRDPSHEEEKHAAQLIQRNYRGYRERRQLQGMGLDANSRWAEVNWCPFPHAKFADFLPRLSKTVSFHDIFVCDLY